METYPLYIRDLSPGQQQDAKERVLRTKDEKLIKAMQQGLDICIGSVRLLKKPHIA